MESLFRALFGECRKKLYAVIDEDAGYTDHLVGQKNGPYYCGTAFCGHHTKAAARKCWKDKCDAIAPITARGEALIKQGKYDEAHAAFREADVYYPELNPANWPINRSSTKIRAEYIEKIKHE